MLWGRRRPCHRTEAGGAVPQVFHSHSLLCPLEDEPPVSTALPIGLTSRACWAPDEAARLVVVHRDDSGVQWVVTTYELGVKKSRDAMNVLGKDPCRDPWACMSPTLHQMLPAQIPHFFFSRREYSDARMVPYL